MISKLHYITQGKTPQEHLDNIQRACASGIEWVELRLKKQDPKTILETAKKAREITSHFQTRLIINTYYKVAKEVNADGVYLENLKVLPSKVRTYLGKFYSVGAAANTLKQCEKLLTEKVDYIGLGPFVNTDVSKNKKESLQKVGYQVILDELKTDTPIFAVGGVAFTNVADLIKTGVFGVRVSNEITKNFNIIPQYHQLLKAPSTNEMVYKFDDNK
ncbi:MAG: thiamine phosphate synthase [Tenacibaculum sp.]